MLQLVGDTIDAERAHLRAEAGELVHLVRGVYVDAATDIEAKILRHAIRIARYLIMITIIIVGAAVLDRGGR